MVVNKGHTLEDLKHRTPQAYSSIMVDRRIKARLDELAARVRAAERRWVPFWRVFEKLADLYDSVTPRPQQADIDHWMAFHREMTGPNRGRPRKPGSVPRVSRASKKASGLPRSPGITD